MSDCAPKLPPRNKAVNLPITHFKCAMEVKTTKPPLPPRNTRAAIFHDNCLPETKTNAYSTNATISGPPLNFAPIKKVFTSIYKEVEKSLLQPVNDQSIKLSHSEINITKNMPTAENIEPYEKLKEQPTSSGKYIAKPSDMRLSTQWFTNLANSANFPAEITNSTYSYKWISGNEKTVVLFACTHEDLSRSKYRIIYNDPRNAVCEQMHFDPPPTPPISDLVKAHFMYGPQIVQFCFDKWGTQVGNGECWTLVIIISDFKASEALKSIPGCMSSHSKTHGVLIYSSIPNEVEVVDQPREGDIIQYRCCKFVRSSGITYTGIPDHTSIIIQVEPNNEFKIAEQNTGGEKSKVVKEGRTRLNDLKEGYLRIFRPIWNTWAENNIME